MDLKNLDIKKWYDSDVDNVLRDFYIPALSESVLYKRLAGFFSSSSLAVAAKGISKLIENGGIIELVTSPRFQKSDIEAIKNAYKDLEELTEKIMLDELENLADQFVKDHVSAFGWMLANKFLTIKVAIVLDENRLPLEEKSIKSKGLFHQKVGIFEDSKGNKLSFSGSENESASGWQYNIEEFKVFRNWIDSEIEYFTSDEMKFNKYWKGYPHKTRVIDLPMAVRYKLIEIAPSDIEELNLKRWYDIKEREKKPIVLRDYQKEAINEWFLNDMKGIFEMATGTGKTYAALGCLNSLLNKKDELITIIACPYNHLITQWIKEIDKFGISLNYVIADSTKPRWKDKLADKLLDIEIGKDNKLLILTTHNTLPSTNFRNLIKSSSKPFLIIVDEVHGIGAPKRRQGLLDRYQYRLGLSATPKRWFDLEGTEFLFNYFDDTVYNFPFSKAIGPFLIEYEYHPHFVSLTEEELEKYERETEKIAKAYYAAKDDKEREEWYNLLCIKRQDTVKNAYNKYQILRDLINENREIEHCLVYCSHKQIETVQEILLEHNIKQHKFTQKEGTRPKEKYGGITERDYLLKQFSNGALQVLVAMKCLDEGVDIPPARFAIMMSNSGNPREYIQRRGRILRKHPDKEIGIIHDIIVIPTPTSLSSSAYSEIERKIFTKELKRYKEFSNIARNSVNCLSKIERLEEKYRIYG